MVVAENRFGMAGKIYIYTTLTVPAPDADVMDCHPGASNATERAYKVRTPSVRGQFAS